MNKKQDRQGVRKASELEQKYPLGGIEQTKNAAIAATRAAGNANTAAVNANLAAMKAQQAVADVERELALVAEQTDFVIVGTVTEDGTAVELDKSFAEILAAAQKNRKCTVVIGGDGLRIFDMVFAGEGQIRFQQLTEEGVLVSLTVFPE